MTDRSRRLTPWFGVAIHLTWAAMAHAEPFTPTRDDDVLEQLPVSAAVRELRPERAALARDPQNLDLALELALAYVRLGRSEADPRYDGYAESVLAPWWDLEQPPSPVLILRATLRQRRHDFATALADLDQVLGRTPRHLQALLTKANLLAVQGERRRALDTCMQLPGSVDAVIRKACRAGVTAGLAEGENSHRELQGALQRESTAPEVRVWALTILGEGAAMRGDDEAAEAHFQAALAEGVHDPYLLGTYADLLLDQGRASEVLELLDGEARIDPLLLRLAIAGRRLGTDGWLEQVELLRARFETARRRGDQIHLREHARFALDLLDQPAVALRLALDDWAGQREPWDARLVLEAALAAGQPAAAQPVLEWLRQTGLEDARLLTLLEALEEATS